MFRRLAAVLAYEQRLSGMAWPERMSDDAKFILGIG
jgi:hypothetical protein